ncbi:hypothetical protein B0G62_108114 [Paraburkholderia eburnea]|uniref:Uncharacterized protein n=1 Tax=Paraburkholderia eburnea TaxID=1189126 RepID=A0A2S4M7C6_9BURK|nr:hypothetical protein [Paraburkholderia eburnea]POR50622.1 hypothetical protein B0G62_108114 [Paraburkholderia eburnea]PRZ21390.1 hypothetical protein BX588_109114 [Paraburkholderia eburnea]
MNRPWLSVEAILEQFRLSAEECAEESSGRPAPADCVQWLAEFLAREHATMNAEDWEALVHVGGTLWRDETTKMH